MMMGEVRKCLKLEYDNQKKMSTVASSITFKNNKLKIVWRSLQV